jgi:4-hydroxy-tetrahydrodipicolinate synthase
MNDLDLRGLIAAIVTPMHEDRTVDESSLRRYVGWLADQGVHGMAVNVDTGEGPHLFPDERLRVLEVVTEEVGDRVVIVAGLGASFTEQAVRTAKNTAGLGVDAFLVFPISAYQGSPLDPRIPAAYHRAIAEATGVPLIAFQLQPALGGVNYEADVLAELLEVDGVVAIKEASFDAKRFVETVRQIRESHPSITILNGNDNFLLEAYVLGAEGALLGFGTLAAAEQVAMLEAVRQRDLDRAFELGPRLQTLCDVIFLPPVRNYRARIKHALMRLGLIDRAVMRPPLLELEPDDVHSIDQALKEAGLLA